MCAHERYAGTTLAGEEVILPCDRCELEQILAEHRAERREQDRRDERDRLADYSGIRDGADSWD